MVTSVLQFVTDTTIQGQFTKPDFLRITRESDVYHRQIIKHY